jgi:hypothetical protein
LLARISEASFRIGVKLALSLLALQQLWQGLPALRLR